MGFLRAGAVLLALLLASWASLEAAPGDPRVRAARVAGMLPPEGTRVDPKVHTQAVDAVSRWRQIGDTPAARLNQRMTGLGMAWRDGRPVRAHLLRALPVTLVLVGTAAAMCLLAGLLLGFLAARRRAADRWIGWVTAIALAVPVAWLCLVGLRVFAWGMPWRLLPARGGLLLPASCLALAAAAALARLVRAQLVDARGEAFVQAARARGASEDRALAVHALGARAAQLVAFAPALLGWLLGAAPVVERAFDLPGLGALLLGAAALGDAPVVSGAVLCFGALVLGVSALADVAVSWADPRRRGGA